MQQKRADVVVLGAGPAGCCAALRLLTLGYSVAVIERQAFPRPQIGESISPGMENILEYIGANTVLQTSHFLSALPTRIIWSQPEAQLLPNQQHARGMIVDRAQFDRNLLHLVRMRGAEVLQPAQVKSIAGEPYHWQLQVNSAQQHSYQIDTRLILDATGRAKQYARKRVSTAPPTLALWTQIKAGVLPYEICTEAINEGWLWGAPLPNALYRVMAFLDAERVKTDPLEKLFCTLLNNGKLFQAATEVDFLSPIAVCDATPYLDLAAWQTANIKLGEAAFALDPLSSSGVEKAMRFSLQAVIAVNTLLHDATMATMAADFYQSHLLESVAMHTKWTGDYYQSAWPAMEQEFWRRRREFRFTTTEQTAPLILRLQEISTMAEQSPQEEMIIDNQVENGSLDFGNLRTFLQAPILLSPHLCLIKTACVIDDRVQLRLAITHPNLARPLAFLAGIELVPLLEVVPLARNLGQLIGFWSMQMPIHTAARIVGWLWQRGLLLKP